MIFNDKIYSRKPFDDYVYRVRCLFILKDVPNCETFSLDVYTTETNKDKIFEAIDKLKSDKVLSFSIINYFTREEDEKTSEMLSELLKDF